MSYGVTWNCLDLQASGCAKLKSKDQINGSNAMVNEFKVNNKDIRMKTMTYLFVSFLNIFSLAVLAYLFMKMKICLHAG